MKEFMKKHPVLEVTCDTVLSPLAYPGHDWLSMTVCIGVTSCKVKLLKLGIYCFAAMEWVCNVGYEMFPWVSIDSIQMNRCVL